MNQTPEGVGEGMAISVNHLKVGIDRCVPVGWLAGADGVAVAAYAAAGGVAVLGVAIIW